jgi:hypothetical protein
MRVIARSDRIDRNTDYILVPTKEVATATAALKKDGWEFIQ